jgi:hypothetical protein
VTCAHWEKREAMAELGYVPSAAIGYCALLKKFTEAKHGRECPAYAPPAAQANKTNDEH